MGGPKDWTEEVLGFEGSQDQCVLSPGVPAGVESGRHFQIAWPELDTPRGEPILLAPKINDPLTEELTEEVRPSVSPLLDCSASKHFSACMSRGDGADLEEVAKASHSESLGSEELTQTL